MKIGVSLVVEFTSKIDFFLKIKYSLGFLKINNQTMIFEVHCNRKNKTEILEKLFLNTKC